MGRTDSNDNENNNKFDANDRVIGTHLYNADGGFMGTQLTSRGAICVHRETCDLEIDDTVEALPAYLVDKVTAQVNSKYADDEEEDE